ncbi:MAG TPA: hypothetical protein VHX14_15040 [Thermoanaerobaculia bacterium]|jgi:hypothetical protein|nr:hypothetical protein [Thermoanaerobaculia bacterium]
MKRLAFVLLLVVPIACATRQPGTTKAKTTRGRGEIELTVTPNPVLANNTGGTSYEFPFDVVVKEKGGHPVTIDRVTANVYAGGGISVASESYDAPKIQSLGFATSIPAKGELHYHFNPKKDVADPSLFSSIYGDVRVEAIDDNGTRASATTTITVKKK